MLVLAYPARVQRGGAVASIQAFLKPSDGVFDDHATRVMGEAFEAARKKLHSRGQDPVRLRNAGLAGLAQDRD